MLLNKLHKNAIYKLWNMYTIRVWYWHKSIMPMWLLVYLCGCYYDYIFLTHELIWKQPTCKILQLCGGLQLLLFSLWINQSMIISMKWFTFWLVKILKRVKMSSLLPRVQSDILTKLLLSNQESKPRNDEKGFIINKSRQWLEAWLRDLNG